MMMGTLGRSNIARVGLNGMPARRIQPAPTVSNPGMAVANSRQPMSSRGMMLAGNTEISPNSMKAEALNGRKDNVACKRAFKAGAFCGKDD